MNERAVHWSVFGGHKWDGNPFALEPIEIAQPACGVRSNDYPALQDDTSRVTCKRCLAVLRSAQRNGHPA